MSGVWGWVMAWAGLGAGSTGRRGEAEAARHLGKKGYKILGRNLRGRAGEVDLLALAPDGRTVVVVEVKARAGGEGADRPELRVGAKKQRKLAGLAVEMARRHGLTDRAFRFDVIGVDLPVKGKPTVRHFEGAFEGKS